MEQAHSLPGMHVIYEILQSRRQTLLNPWKSFG